MNLEENYTTIEQDQDSLDFFFDTYAIFEIINQNKNYEKYLNSGIITTKLNIFELYFNFLKEGKEDLANSYLNKYYQFAEDFDEEIIKSAAILKKNINKRNVSMTDCIGYCLAKQWGVKFLTGDKEFKDLPNVEFVK